VGQLDGPGGLLDGLRLDALGVRLDALGALLGLAGAVGRLVAGALGVEQSGLRERGAVLGVADLGLQAPAELAGLGQLGVELGDPAAGLPELALERLGAFAGAGEVALGRGDARSGLLELALDVAERLYPRAYGFGGALRLGGGASGLLAGALGALRASLGDLPALGGGGGAGLGTPARGLRCLPALLGRGHLRRRPCGLVGRCMQRVQGLVALALAVGQRARDLRALALALLAQLIDTRPCLGQLPGDLGRVGALDGQALLRGVALAGDLVELARERLRTVALGRGRGRLAIERRQAVLQLADPRGGAATVARALGLLGPRGQAPRPRRREIEDVLAARSDRQREGGAAAQRLVGDAEGQGEGARPRIEAVGGGQGLEAARAVAVVDDDLRVGVLEERGVDAARDAQE
jgi:hypothetical protein